MTALTKREPTLERFGVLDWFDRMFDEWMKVLPGHRPMLFGRWWTDDMIHVDEFRENGTLVIRAELPGIDPDEDVALTVADGMLTIEAERHEDEQVEEQGYLCRELRHGSFVRTLPLPPQTTGAGIKANYKDGILEIRVPAPKAVQTKKIPIDKG